MVDMVENHVAWIVPSNSAAFNPANGQYGALNQSTDYHLPCVINYNSVQNRDVCESFGRLLLILRSVLSPFPPPWVSFSLHLLLRWR